MAFETLVFQALRNRLVAFNSPTLPINWFNDAIAFVPPVDGEGRPLPYLKADLLWNRNVNRFIKHTSTTEHRGIFQVTVIYPSYMGIVTVTDIAGNIANWFERGTVISVTGCKVEISGKPDLGGYSQDGLTVRLPITIEFYAFE